MPRKRHIMGLFKDENSVVSAIDALKQSSFKFIRVNTPFPSHKIMGALKLKKSMVGWFTLCGGILGFMGGFGLAIYASTQWDLIVAGKPIVALIPFVIVGFEGTILFSVFGNVIGLLILTRLPSYRWLRYYDPLCSGERFGVLAACEIEQEDGLKEFFQNQGADVKVFEQ
ncbi:MAG: DUF3341 domain-containing protein [Desulfobacterales bacterium]|jgi:hypothetical protein